MPDTIEELAKFALVGREKLTAVRAEIRAIDRLKLADSVRIQKIEEAQYIAEAVLDAEMRVGELLKAIPPQITGRPPESKHSGEPTLMPKQAAREAAGISRQQADRYIKLADNPEVVENAKSVARANDDIISRSLVLDMIKTSERESAFNLVDIDWKEDDEVYTPAYAVEPILKYIEPNSIVWCPFDTQESIFVKKLKEAGHTVIATHISNGSDFFKISVPECDYIISNPPYSVKGEVLKRLFKIGKPFGMLVSVVGLFESQERFEMFRDNVFEIMYMNRRIVYFKDYSEPIPYLNPPFSSVYVCHKMLPKQIIFEEIHR